VTQPRLLRERSERVCTLVLNRPQVLNAIDRALLEELDKALDDLQGDPEIRGLVITGAGDRAFSSGADVRELARLSATDAVKLMRYGQAVFRRLSRLPYPVVAAVRGFALGGGFELVQWCDIVVASTDAVFGHPEITLANVPGWGGSQLLPRLIGRSRAAWIILTGTYWPALAAREAGLVHLVVPPEKVLASAQGLAQDLSARSPAALRIAKRLLWEATDSRLSEGLAREAEGVGECWTTVERQRALESFLTR
jgi:enoyl-CoA hydratase